jgi:FdhD protein
MALYSSILIQKWLEGNLSPLQEHIADESLITLVVNDSKLTQLLSSNDSLPHLAIGHLATEYGVRLHTDAGFIIEREPQHVSINLGQIESIQTIDIPRLVTTSCGGCDSPTVEGLMSSIPIVDDEKLNISIEDIHAIYQSHFDQSEGFSKTGGMHSASLVDKNGQLMVMKEDIGRHNAVDKVVGHALVEEQIDQAVALLVSGRIGWDIVAKAGRMGIGTIVGLGACSTLAAEAARSSNISIISFLKNDSAVVIGPVKIQM